MKRKIDPSEYMVDGWDRQGEVDFVRGSRHNKIGMTIMWTYYVFFIFSGRIQSSIVLGRYFSTQRNSSLIISKSHIIR